ncbi:MAG: PIN domain-containing protein [Candidatus Bathyarchaeales archaeon]
MTEKYIIDAYAWIEYLIGSEAGAKIKQLIEEENNELYTSAVTLAEVISKIAREKQNVEAAYDIITSNSNIIDVNDQLSKETGILHAKMQKTKKDFGLADAYVLATATKIGAKIITGDPHFKNIKEAIIIQP